MADNCFMQGDIIVNILVWLSIGLDRRTPSEHLLTAITEALCKKGHKVHILQKDTGGDKAGLTERMTELNVTTTRIKCVPSKRRNLAARYFEDVQYVLKCRKWIKQHKEYDRVFMQSSNVAGLQVHSLRKILKDIPITFNVQDIFPENAVYSGTLSNQGLLYGIFSAIQRYAYRNVQHIITISEDMKEQLVEIGTPEQNIETIYNWSYQDEVYDQSTIDYSAVTPFFDNTKFNVVYAGNIGRMQHVEIILQVADLMKDHNDIAFHIFGEGVYRDKLLQSAQELCMNNVFFHGMLDSKDAPALYSIADINVIPLAKNIYRTALPSKTATCLACGKPIIMAIGKKAIFGISMTKKENVYLTGSDDVQEIANAIMDIKCHQNKDILIDNSFYRNCFSKTINSQRYADIIAG